VRMQVKLVIFVRET